MLRKLLIIIIGLAFVGLSACSNTMTPIHDPSTPSPGEATSNEISQPSSSPGYPASSAGEDILKKTISAMFNVTTYKLDVNLTKNENITPEPPGNEPYIYAIIWKSNRIINYPDKKLQMSMTIEGETKPSMVFDMLIIDGWQYFKSISPQVFQNGTSIISWEKSSLQNLADWLWSNETQISSVTGCLKSIEDVSITGDGNINGIECNVLKITPSASAMEDWIVSQQQPQGPSFISREGGKEIYLRDYQNSTVNLWVDQDSFRILKADITAQFSNFDFNCEMVFSDYDQPQAIETPSDSEIDQGTTTPVVTASNEPNTEITFKDPNLEAGIRQQMGKPQGAIHVSDAQKVVVLTIVNSNIKDLSGLEYFDHLNVLIIPGNAVSDLSPLKNLHIAQLDLQNNQIKDISPLAQVPGLFILSLNNNQVSDISPLSSLPYLQNVELDGNAITDLSPLLNLPSLQILSIRDNPLSVDSLNKYIPQLIARGVNVNQ